jgi:hypothetical protein
MNARISTVIAPAQLAHFIVSKCSVFDECGSFWTPGGDAVIERPSILK